MLGSRGSVATRLAGAAGVLLGLTALTGCPKPNPQLTGAQLTGTVRLKGGGPLPGGEITLIGVDDATKVQPGFIRADGKYEVLNAPVGEMKVVIDTHSVKGHPGLLPGGDAAKAEELYGGKLKYVAIDKKYADPEKTPLRVTTNPGDNTKDFEVE